MGEWQIFWFSLFGFVKFVFSWQVWIAAIGLLAYSFTNTMALGLLASKLKNGIGCWTSLLTSVFQAVSGAVAMAIVIGFLFPIMLGSSHTTNLATFLTFLPALLGAALYAMLCVIVMYLVPVLGQLLTAGGPALPAFIEGAIIFKSLATLGFKVYAANADAPSSQVLTDKMFASGWSWFGYCTVTAILTMIVLGVCLAVELAFWKRMTKIETDGEELPPGMKIFGPSITILVGLCVTFMYADYTVLSLQSYRAESETRAKALAKEGKFKEAAEQLSNALSVPATNPNLRIDRAFCYEHLGLYKKVVEDCNYLLQIDPDSAAALMHRGGAYASLDDPQKGLADLDRAVHLAPDAIGPYSYRALVSFGIGKYDDCIRDATKAISIDPTDSPDISLRGAAYVELKNWQAALNDINTLVKLDPGNSEHYLHRAFVRSKLGQYKEAIADCDEAIKHNSNYAKAYHYRGKFYAELGNNELSDRDKEMAKKLGFEK